jgi:hypothetical protein
MGTEDRFATSFVAPVRAQAQEAKVLKMNMETNTKRKHYCSQISRVQAVGMILSVAFRTLCIACIIFKTDQIAERP